MKKNGEYRVIDARPFLVGPAFEPIKDPAIFKKVSVDNAAGTVSWLGEVDIDPDVLYAQSFPLELPSKTCGVWSGPSGKLNPAWT